MFVGAGVVSGVGSVPVDQLILEDFGLFIMESGGAFLLEDV